MFLLRFDMISRRFGFNIVASDFNHLESLIQLTNWMGGFCAVFRQMMPSARLNSRYDLSILIKDANKSLLVTRDGCVMVVL